MRLRSSQFVFLLLLACSVHPGESPTRQLAAGVVTQFAGASAGRYERDAQTRDVHASPAPRSPVADVLSLSARAASSWRAVWGVRSPARTAATITHISSYLRG